MKSNLFFVSMALVAAVTTTSCSRPTEQQQVQTPTRSAQTSVTPQRSFAPEAATASRATNTASPHDHSPGHGHGAEETPMNRVPAFQIDPASLKNLLPTLSAEQFFGRQREAYAAVKEIPQTIAQLPCYCHCDRGFGHKSLHSCFVDSHAAHCAVCVDEALLAYGWQKQEKLSPQQIRERIIAKYSEGN